MATENTGTDRLESLLEQSLEAGQKLIEAVESGKADAQHGESFVKEIADIKEQAAKAKEQADADNKAAADTKRLETEENVYRITDPAELEKSAEEVGQSVSEMWDYVRGNLANNRGVAMTILPDVFSNTPSRTGGAEPEFYWKQKPNGIPGASEAGAGGVHIYAQNRMRVPQANLNQMSAGNIAFAGKPDADDNRKEQNYKALALNMNRMLSAVTTGTAGAGNIPGGTIFDPVPQMLDAYTGPMLNPAYWDVRVTPTDINDYRILQISVESAASNRGENVAKSVTDPTTAEVTVGAHKVATDGEFTKEATMKNYINSFEDAFEDQALHAHTTKLSTDLTNGSGTGNNPLGIITAFNAVAGIPTLGVSRAAVDAIDVDQVTYMQLKALLKPGLRRAPLVVMFSDALHFRAIIQQLQATAPGYSLPFDMTGADDDMGYLGRIFGMYLQSNEAVTEPTASLANNTPIGIIVSGKSWITRTTGTTVSFNPYDEEARDVISVYLRTWVDGAIKKPQVAGNYTAGILRSTT